MRQTIRHLPGSAGVPPAVEQDVAKFGGRDVRAPRGYVFADRPMTSAPAALAAARAAAASMLIRNARTKARSIAVVTRAREETSRFAGGLASASRNRCDAIA